MVATYVLDLRSFEIFLLQINMAILENAFSIHLKYINCYLNLDSALQECRYRSVRPKLIAIVDESNAREQER